MVISNGYLLKILLKGAISLKSVGLNLDGGIIVYPNGEWAFQSRNEENWFNYFVGVEELYHWWVKELDSDMDSFDKLIGMIENDATGVYVRTVVSPSDGDKIWGTYCIDKRGW